MMVKNILISQEYLIQNIVPKASINIIDRISPEHYSFANGCMVLNQNLSTLKL